MGEMAAKASSERKLLVAPDLGATRWQFAATDGQSGKVSEASLGRATVAEGKAALLERLGQARRVFGLPDDAGVTVCYEAGRDGFWIQRWLEAEGAKVLVVDPASIEVSRRAKRAKTDRLETRALVQLLVRQQRGEDALGLVEAPDPAAEDARLQVRTLHDLKNKRGRERRYTPPPPPWHRARRAGARASARARRAPDQAAPG